MRLVSRFLVNDRELSDLHARAFGGTTHLDADWSKRLSRHALTWIGAFDIGKLVGFIQVCWDEGSHAFLLDSAVDLDWQRQGIGTSLVRRAAEEAKAAGCEWLHVDCDDDMAQFYFKNCRFQPTTAGVRSLFLTKTSRLSDIDKGPRVTSGPLLNFLDSLIDAKRSVKRI